MPKLEPVLRYKRPPSAAIDSSAVVYSAGGGVGHDPVTLASSADVLLGILGQELSLDKQVANAVLAGPSSGNDAAPTFRVLADADIPAHAIISKHSAAGSQYQLVGLTATDTLGLLTPSSAPGGAAAILRTDAAGKLSLQELAVADIGSHLLPKATDTYDLGSSSALWRKGWLSELDAVLFAQNTITLLGGWFYVTKYSGTAQEDIDSAETQIDLGADSSTLAQNDFIVFRQAGKVEYMQLGTYVGSNVWNVTRNKDGSGADTWPQGAPFTCLGYDGTGRLEMDATGATGTPRLSVIRQGTTYNAQTELVRVGNLNGNWGYASDYYGLAIGEYASGKANIVLDQDGAVKIRTYATTRIALSNAGVLTIRNSSGNPVFRFDGSGSAEFYAPLSISESGGIYQGSGTFAEPTTGLKIWNDGGVGRIAGYNAGTAQWYADTAGRFYAGGGAVRLNQYGLRGFAGATERFRLWNDGSGWVGASDVFAWDTNGIVAFKADGLIKPWLMPSLSDALTWPNQYGGGKLMYAWKPVGEELAYGPVSLAQLNLEDTDFSATAEGGPYVDLDGSAEYLYTNSTLWPQIESNLYLFWIWVNADTLSTERGIAGVWNVQGGFQSWLLRWRQPVGAFSFSVSSTGANQHTIDSSYSESTATWYFIACYYQPSTLIRIWVGKESDSSLTINSNTTSIPSSVFDGRDAGFRLGCYRDSSGNNNYFFDGKIGCFGGWRGVPASSVNNFVEQIWKKTRPYYVT